MPLAPATVGLEMKEEAEEWVFAESGSAAEAASPPQEDPAAAVAAAPSDEAQGHPSQPGALSCEATFERQTLSTDAHEASAVLSVAAPALEGASRAPLRLVAVLDKSGSMHGDKLRLVGATMRFMLRHLEARDQLGLVEYDTEVKVLAPLTACDETGRARLDAALARLRPGSQTNLSGGLLRGLGLHGTGAATDAGSARAELGNTYRQLSEEEEAAGPSYGTGAPPEGARRCHEWSMELRFGNSEDASRVAKVRYILHNTFAEPVVDVEEPPFRLTRRGWGYFTVHVEVHLKDSRVVKLEHDLVFGQAESFRTVLLPVRPPTQAERADAANDGAIRSTFLFTDGLANVGITATGDLVAAARSQLEELGDRRCTVSTFGFGADHSAELLQGLADAGAGTYSYVENEDQIGQAFGEALGGLLSTTHQNVRLSLSLAPGVRVARACTDYATEVSEGADGAQTLAVELGDLFAEERRDILVKLALPASEATDRQVVGHLSTAAFSVRAVRSETSAVVACAVARGAALHGELDHHVERHRNRFVATEALKTSKQAAERGQLDEARRLLNEALGALGASPLAAAGDAVTLSLIGDVQECIGDLRSQERYRAVASKKMTCMQQGHSKQRCANIQSTAVYMNTVTMTMKDAFTGVGR
mmetsp:Transcript_2057/g.6207  ORF Transcript_2057/g.6207 Transcript_2057/m.6207 type:complete len:649 (+) Transcript_2057:94-2040(+)